MPAKAGIQIQAFNGGFLDSRLRGNDEAAIDPLYKKRGILLHFLIIVLTGLVA